MRQNKCAYSNLEREPISCAVNVFDERPAIWVVVVLLTVAIVATSAAVHAGESQAGATHRPVLAAKQAPIEVVRDKSGKAMFTRFGESTSFNWSGYVLPSFMTQQTYSSAHGTWQVPQVVWQGITASSSNWVGIGGFCEDTNCKKTDNSLIQVGTEQDSLSSSRSHYFAWYEMLPRATKMTTLTVRPGDIMTASLTCSGKCKGTQHWTLSMTNETTGKNWRRTFQYNSSKLSAEWIEEAPSNQHGVVPLADFGTTTFVQSMVNGTSADLSTGDSIVMMDKHGQTSSVSATNSTMDGFTACFGETRLSACSFISIP